MHACNVECASVDFNIKVKVMSKLLLIRNIVKFGTVTLVYSHLYHFHIPQMAVQAKKQ